MCFESLFIRLAFSSSMGPITMLKHNRFISGHAADDSFFFFSFKEEDTQLYFPWMLINVLPDGQEWKPFHSGRFRDNPESTTNSSESLDRRESLSLAALVCWSTYQVQASRYDYRDSSGSLCVAELLSKDLRLTPIYCPINLPPVRYRFHSQRYHVLFNYDTC